MTTACILAINRGPLIFMEQRSFIDCRAIRQMSWTVYGRNCCLPKKGPKGPFSSYNVCKACST